MLQLRVEPLTSSLDSAELRVFFDAARSASHPSAPRRPFMPAPESAVTPTGGTAPSRRTMLKGAAVGVAGIAGLPLLAACTGASSGGGGGSSKSTSLGSSASDDVPKRAI